METSRSDGEYSQMSDDRTEWGEMKGKWWYFCSKKGAFTLVAVEMCVLVLHLLFWHSLVPLAIHEVCGSTVSNNEFDIEAGVRWELFGAL